jgi:hypothetical protein
MQTLSGWFFIRLWSWRLKLYPKRRYLITRLHGGTAQQTDDFVFMAVKTAAFTHFDPVFMPDGKCSVFRHMRTMRCIRTYADNVCLASENLRSVFLYFQTYVVFSLSIQKLWIVCPVYPGIFKFVFCNRTDADNVFSLSGYLRTCSLFSDMYFVSGQLRTMCPVLPDKCSFSCVAGQLRIQINTTNHVLNLSAKFLSWVCLCFSISCYELSMLTWFSLWFV